MKSVLTAAALFAGLLLSACDWSSIGFNGKCKEYCASVDVTENETQANIDSAMKQKCEGMGRHGTPQVLDKSRNSSRVHLSGVVLLAQPHRALLLQVRPFGPASRPGGLLGARRAP